MRRIVQSFVSNRTDECIKIVGNPEFLGARITDDPMGLLRSWLTVWALVDVDPAESQKPTTYEFRILQTAWTDSRSPIDHPPDNMVDENWKLVDRVFQRGQTPYFIYARVVPPMEM